jgi:ornithine cyclodeaminase
LQEGTHVNLVGSAVRSSAEGDTEVVKRSKFFVDYKESALAQASELLNTIEDREVSESHIAGEIGEVLLGQVPGRTTEKEITVYKSLGVSAQDLAASLRAYQYAKAKGKGVSVDW